MLRRCAPREQFVTWLDRIQTTGKTWFGGAREGAVGGVAQLGEHLLCKQGVVGSNPIVSTKRARRARRGDSERQVSAWTPRAEPLLVRRQGARPEPCPLCKALVERALPRRRKAARVCRREVQSFDVTVPVTPPWEVWCRGVVGTCFGGWALYHCKSGSGASLGASSWGPLRTGSARWYVCKEAVAGLRWSDR